MVAGLRSFWFSGFFFYNLQFDIAFFILVGFNSYLDVIGYIPIRGIRWGILVLLGSYSIISRFYVANSVIAFMVGSSPVSSSQQANVSSRNSIALSTPTYFPEFGIVK